MKTNWGYHWLCLCLIFLFSMPSCVIKRNGSVQKLPVIHNGNSYQLQIKLITYVYPDELPGQFNQYLLYPYNIIYRNNILIIRPEAVILYFRFPDLNLLQQCRDQLLSTGEVTELNITTIENL
jgi:hypothetical protein